MGLHLFRFLKIFLVIPYVFCSIKTPGNVIKNVVEDVVFMWNTTNGNSIISVTWGLLSSDDTTVTPQFIYITKRIGAPVLLDDLNTTALRYKGRVSWVGDLSTGHAWFKITNLKIQDTNKYAAAIIEQGESQESGPYSIHLSVAVCPRFLPSHPNNTYQIIEGQDMDINCTSIGPPTPDITWVNITDGSVVIKSQGSGSAVMHVKKITRYHAGVYECQATNNPNKDATTTRTSVTVYYPPVITATPNAGCIGGKLQLVCKADGLPKPTMILKDSSGNELFNTTGKGEISHSIEVKKSSQFDNYTCIAINYLGNASHVIFPKEESCPSPTPNPGTGSKVPAGVIAGVAIVGVLAIAGLVIALIFCYRRKTLEKDSGRSGVRQERTVQMSSLPDHEDHYASVQHNQDNQGTPTEPVLQYAKVDKTKKKIHNPDELVYADLALDAKDDYGSKPISVRHPTNESDTVYADIAGNRKNPEPQYGNLQGRDIVI